MSDDATVQDLRAELERVKQECDVYRKAVQALMAEKYLPPTEEQMKAEIEEIERNGIPFEQLLAELEARLGTGR